MLIGLLSVSALGLRETFTRHRSDCETSRASIVRDRELARGDWAPLPVPPEGSLTVINQIVAENAHRKAVLDAFLARHPVPSCG